MGNTKDERFVAKRLIKLYLVLIFVLGVVAAVLAIHAFSTRGLFGYSARIVMSTSMEKDPGTNVEAYAIGEIPARSFVLLELVPAGEEAREAFYAGLREGDVLTFVYRVMGGDVTITHRVRGIERRGVGYVITLRGDNGTSVGSQVINAADPAGGRVIGKAVSCSHALGVCICILRDPLFLLSAFILVLAAALLHELLCKSDPPRFGRGPSKGGKDEKKGNCDPSCHRACRMLFCPRGEYHIRAVSRDGVHADPSRGGHVEGDPRAAKTHHRQHWRRGRVCPERR